jgi:hypothetical protein
LTWLVWAKTTVSVESVRGGGGGGSGLGAVLDATA